MILEAKGKCTAHASEGRMSDGSNNLYQQFVAIFGLFMYYQPAVICGRMAWRFMAWVVNSIIKYFAAVLSYLTDNDLKNIKPTVERLLGFIIQLFGTVIGYDYEKLNSQLPSRTHKE